MSLSEHESARARSIPLYEVVEFSPPTSRYCVIVFVINEGERIRRQLSRMSELRLGVDVVVADGGSVDGSLEPQFLTSVHVTALLTKTGNGRLSAQMRMAFDWASRMGYSGVVVIDGNDKDDPAAIPDFIDLLDQGYDHVQGSRFVKGGRAIRTPWSRYLAVRIIHAPLISIASGKRQTDTTNGFRAYSMRLIEDPQIDVFREVFDSYELHYHLAIESARSGHFRTIETPVTRAYPAKQKTPTKISPVQGNARVLGILIKAALGRYRAKDVM